MREKGGGVLEGLPLATTFNKAKEQGVPVRAYRPEKGECWIDVMNRAKKFLSELADSYIFNKERVGEEKKEIKKEPKKELKKEAKKELPRVYGKGLYDEHKEGPKQILKTIDKKPIAKKHLPRILAVTHGGFIMEFINAYRETKGLDICEKNIAKNTAIYIFQIGCANCKGVCKGILCKDKKIAITLIKENDNKHLTLK